MAVEFLARAALGPVLRPTGEDGEEAIDAMRGKDVLCRCTVPVNARFRAKLFDVLNLVYKNQDRYKSREALREAVLIALGFCHEVRLINGSTTMIPDSMSFAKLDDASFKLRIYDPFKRLVCTDLIPGLDDEDLERELLSRTT